MDETQLVSGPSHPETLLSHSPLHNSCKGPLQGNGPFAKEGSCPPAGQAQHPLPPSPSTSRVPWLLSSPLSLSVTGTPPRTEGFSATRIAGQWRPDSAHRPAFWIKRGSREDGRPLSLGTPDPRSRGALSPTPNGFFSVCPSACHPHAWSAHPRPGGPAGAVRHRA